MFFPIAINETSNLCLTLISPTLLKGQKYSELPQAVFQIKK